MKKFLFLILCFSLFSCGKCVKKDIWFESDIKNICNIDVKASDYILKDKKSISNNLYEISTKGYDIWLNFLQNNKDLVSKNNLSYTQKIKLYYILKDIFKYTPSQIKDDFNLEIDKKYLNLNLKIDRVILWENLLVQVFNKNDLEFDTNWNKVWSIWYLTLDEILYLQDIFNQNIELYDSINLVSSISDAYNSIKNDENNSNEFKKMVEIIKSKSKNKTTLDLLDNIKL